MVGLLLTQASLTEVSFPHPLLGEVSNPVVKWAERNWHTGGSEVPAASLRGAGRQKGSVTWILISLQKTIRSLVCRDIQES